MNTERQDYETVANHKLIKQVAKYYRSTQRDLDIYQNINSQVLENMATKHLMHWKKKLHELIFDGMNCHDERIA